MGLETVRNLDLYKKVGNGNHGIGKKCTISVSQAKSFAT